ncbi:MAG: DEAD/DEAH box helicase family protein [Peptococcaceae bacterium]|nr:DEAD/DEAH box helicase family protein [Peptococcaceae bacterium]
MSNFGFLAAKDRYALFSAACIEAEKIYATSPAMCAVGCRKALELAVKWVYSADRDMQMPYKDNLQALIHEPSFMHAMEYDTWRKLQYVIKLGNRAVHTEQKITGSEAVVSLKVLFEFVDWIHYCYGDLDDETHQFDEAAIPTEEVHVDPKKIKAQESLLGEKDAEIEALRAQIAQMSAELTAAKATNTETRTFTAQTYTEDETRTLFIDEDLKEMGWVFDGVDADVQLEYPVDDMGGISGQKGRVDYVLFGKDGVPLALIEAKRAGRSIGDGKKQASLYADCLARKFGRRPMIFLSNGWGHYVWDDTNAPERRIFNFYSKDDLQKLINRRSERKVLAQIPIDDKITDRYYQKAAIRAVCDQLEQGQRKHLLVMATGTGKTRTASSLTDVLSRGKWVTNILFLADRTALVKQAKDDFKNYLPDMSLCNLCDNKDDRNARIVFSTYPTILNVIDDAKSEGRKLFTPAHFDLIIIDESHRSIFKKYRAIFDYFDGILVGLTATPKTEVDRNTYDFFDMEDGVPTYVYDYETAVNEDHVLVPYYNYEVKTKFLEDGITYDDLSEEDKRRYEDAFAEDNLLPDFIPSNELNKFVFNQSTVDMVLQDLMERGIHVAGGDRLGKTIVFAQNKRHADYIIERFNVLYPQYKGSFAQRVVCDDAYAQNIIDDFKQPEKEPHIAVSVDMMDTGIDVPEVVNLVFFKKIRSKTKFWQMIGRGTRLCKGLECLDEIDGAYTDKRRFLIFDYCGNFEFFRENKEGYESREVKTLTENIFCKRVRLMAALQETNFDTEEAQGWRRELVDLCHGQVEALSPDLIAVKVRREYVERYKDKAVYDILSEGSKAELMKEIAPLVYMDDKDEYAKRFDNFMYGLMLAHMEQLPTFKRARTQLCNTAALLEKKQTIPQVEAKLDLIKEVQTDAFWEAEDVLLFEKVRVALRELMQFLMDDGPVKPIIFTDLADPVIASGEGQTLDPAYDFENYRAKVNRYVNEHGDTIAIHKLTHNIPLSSGDYSELERVLTSELGSAEDYEREYGDTPFGLLIRKIAKLDHEAAMAAFSAFINDQSLNQRQIEFVHKIITHIELNGYMESPKVLMKPPFDKPIPFMKLFDQKTRTALVATINQVRDNAVQIAAM